MKKTKMFEGVKATNKETKEVEYFKDLTIFDKFNFEGLTEKEIDDFKTNFLRCLIINFGYKTTEIENFEFELITERQKEELNLPW